MAICKKSWLLNKVIGTYRWITIFPNIYAANEYFTHEDKTVFQPVIRHEEVHLNRQASYGKWRWLFKYIIDRQFRLHEEALGIAAEVLNTPAENQAKLIMRYANSLTIIDYFWAARNIVEANEAILFAIEESKR